MNIVDIVKNAPEGAERYKVFAKEGCTEYYATINGVKSFYDSIEKQWDEDSCYHYDSSLPLPELKTEWVKVEDPIFELATELKAGELYFDWNGDESDKQAIRTESELVFLRSLHHSIYRKVETLIDEKEEFEVKFNKIAKEHFNSGTEETWTDYLYNKGCRFIELD